MVMKHHALLHVLSSQHNMSSHRGSQVHQVRLCVFRSREVHGGMSLLKAEDEVPDVNLANAAGSGTVRAV